MNGLLNGEVVAALAQWQGVVLIATALCVSHVYSRWLRRARRSSRACGVGLVVVMAIALPWAARSVSAQSSIPSFEVASVRPSPEGARGTRFVWQPDRLAATWVSLRTLIMSAYPGEALRDRIEGGPDWLHTARFDISAVIDPAHIATREQRLQVLRGFLAERFGLVLRREMREQTVYALVMAREDLGLGPSLWPSELDCDAPGRAEGLPLGPGQRPAFGTGGPSTSSSGTRQEPSRHPALTTRLLRSIR